MRINCLFARCALFAGLTLVPAALIQVLAPAAHAQATSGNIAGVVKDSSGAAVPNVKLTLRNEATGVTASVTANGQGEYRADNLLPGAYDIAASAPGFANASVKGVTIALNATATQDITLTPGSNSTVIEVSGEAGVVLDTTTQNLTQTFEPQELSTLPVASIGEGVLNASLLAPGVGSTGGIGIGVGPSIAGQRPRANNFTIEGIDNNNKSVTGPLVYVPNDAVGEFTLITTQFSPEFGHSSGGQFNTNVISGTNHFHGKVYEYFRNRNLDADLVTNGLKAPTKPRYDNNRYGGEVGGPIIREKLFFFANYERNTIGQSSSYSDCVPTSAGLATIKAMSSAAGYSSNNVAEYIKYTPPATLTDAASASSACGATSLLLTSGPDDGNGNQTGTTEATIPLGAYRVNAPNFTNQDAFVVSLDYTLSSKDSFRGRYIYNTTGTPDIAANLPVFWQQLPYRYHLIALSEYHNFTPHLVNEARIGFNRYYNDTPSGNFSYSGLDSFPNLVFFDQGSLQYGPDPNAPQFTIQNLYEFTDNVSYTRGRHSLRFGFDGRKFISPQSFTQRARGDYEYANLSDFLHDYAPDAAIDTAERSTGVFVYYGDQTELYGYANDTYKANEKVTVNFGLRYEFTSVPVGERAQGLNAVASVPGLITFGVPQPSYVNLAPRVGLVFAPDSKTSVRLGYGIAYDTLFDNLGILSSPPEVSQTQDVGSGAACVGGKTCPDYGSPNFLANGGLLPGSGTTSLTHAEAVAGTSAYIPNQVPPYSENYTLTIERQIINGLTAEIGYIGDRGVHLPVQDRYNIQPRTNSSNYLPTYVNGVAINGQGTSATNLAAINANSNVVPAFKAAGFIAPITSYQPWGGSNYNGLIANLRGRLKNGLQLDLAYTWSKAMDNATAEVFATTLTPRRPQNPRDFASEYSRSAFDHTNRLSLEADYNFQPFHSQSNWIMRNIVGNWVVSPIYTYESPEYATVLGGTNGLLTGDGTYVGRTIINANGIKGTASTVSPLLDGSGNIIGYTADTPSAYYIQAASGAMPNASRNTLPGRPTNNLDLSAYKKLTFGERYGLELGVQAFNVLNHPQYLPGSVDDVNSYSYTGLTYTDIAYSTFNHPELVFSNNPRVLQLSGKIIF